MQIIVPDWLAYRTYKFGTENSKTFISNEKRHEYVLLEGLSSDLWKIITDTFDYNKVQAWAKSKGLIDELDNFIDELKNQELLIEGNADGINSNADILPVVSLNEDETLLLESEMIEWCSQNNYLFSLFVELTYNCNLKCIHCYNPKNVNQIQIDFDTLKHAIDNAVQMGCFRITFSGGEATLHDKFIEIVEYARNKNLSVEIFTNGQILYSNQALFDKLLKLYPYRIGISLYSMNENVHEYVTSIKGSYKKTLGVIKKLRSKNVNVEIKDFLLNVNCNDCISLRQFANNIQASSICDLSLIPTIEGNKKTFQYAVSDDNLYELYTNPDSPLSVKNLSKIDIKKIQNESLCYAGSRSLCITPSLDIYPCVSLPINLGNLKEISLLKIWEDFINRNKDSRLYQWQQIKRKDLSECYKNDYCEFCCYCPGMGMLENGFLKKSDILCKQAKIKQKAYYHLKSLKK